jgi:prepilin-type processing-associated H-X9-DG protein
MALIINTQFFLSSIGFLQVDAFTIKVHKNMIHNSIKKNIKKSICLFSLVELFVVTSTLLLIWSILQPSIKRVYDLSREHKCTKNNHAIGLMISLYANDYGRNPSNHRFPGGGSVSVFDHFSEYDGRGKMPDHIKNKAMISDTTYNTNAYTCPNEESYEAKVILNGADQSRVSYSPNAFSVNKIPVGFTGSNTYDSWSEIPEFYPDPQGTLSFAESPGSVDRLMPIGRSSGIHFPHWQAGRNANGTKNNIEYCGEDRERWHRHGWVYLFLDGHVENLIPEETIGTGIKLGYSARGMWTYYFDD